MPYRRLRLACILNYIGVGIALFSLLAALPGGKSGFRLVVSSLKPNIGRRSRKLNEAHNQVGIESCLILIPISYRR